jgi:hypothetical protein
MPKLIDERYDYIEKKTKLKAKEEAYRVSISSDIWTSNSNCSYLGITVHYITEDFKMVKVVPKMIKLNGSHHFSKY